ncbi:MAG TPA: hypothetical protein VL122_04455 [Nitrospirota bacterium]|nr:hypothetical protein [Nitrospirota bacterium]
MSVAIEEVDKQGSLLPINAMADFKEHIDNAILTAMFPYGTAFFLFYVFTLNESGYILVPY